MDVELHLKLREHVMVTSILPVGGFVGALVGGALITRFGRKRPLLLCLFLSFIALIIQYLSRNYWLLTVSRVILGCSHGISTLVLPIYISEIAQKNIRGTLTTFPFLFQIIGISCVYLPSPGFDWHKLSLLAFLLLTPFLIFYWFLPETPRWYLTKNKMAESRKALVRLRCHGYDTDDEFDEMVALYIEKSGQNYSGRVMLTKPFMRPLLISTGLMFFQQMTGVGVFFYYEIMVLKDLHTILHPYTILLIVGTVNLISAIITCVLVDSVGRKTLIYTSAGMVLAALLILSIYSHFINHKHITHYGWIPIVAVLIFYPGYVIGYGYMPFLIMSEILPYGFKDVSASIVTALHYIFVFMATTMYPVVKTYVGVPWCFWIFLLFTVVGVVLISQHVPETSKRTLEQIERSMIGRRMIRSLSEAFSI